MKISGNSIDDIFQPIHYELDTTKLNMFYFKHILIKTEKMSKNLYGKYFITLNVYVRRFCRTKV